MNFIKKKSLGQNFLKSKKVVESIIESSLITPEKIVLEIGPGMGFMTEELLKHSEKLILIEKDHRLIPILKEKFSNKLKDGKLNIYEEDILDFNINILKKYNRPYIVIANIPYYITGQIIRKFLETDYKPETMTLLLQKEVAERITAKDEKESLLSISVKIYGEPKIIRKVSKNLFSPIPKVDSSVILIKNISNKKLDGLDDKLFFKVLKSGFKHKRKKLFSNLKSEFESINLDEIFDELKIDKNIRPEMLRVDGWVKISKKINERNIC